MNPAIGSGVRVATALLLLLVAGATADPAWSQSGEAGFHGYGWGTRSESISMLSQSTSVDRGVEGHRIHAASLRLLGMPTRAVFYFDSADGGLVGGKYLSETTGLSCVAQFRTLRLLVASDVEEARLELRRGTGGDAPSDRAACRRFVEASRPIVPWDASFVDPAAGDTVALVRLLRRGGGPRLMACYRVMTDCRWPEDPRIDSGPVLGPARGDTSGVQPE